MSRNGSKRTYEVICAVISIKEHEDHTFAKFTERSLIPINNKIVIMCFYGYRNH